MVPGGSQTVWNIRHGLAPDEGIKDYDLVYFDRSDLSAEAEKGVEEEIRSRLPTNVIELDLKN